VTQPTGSNGPFALNRLSEIRHLVYTAGWLVAVQFGFDEGFLSVEVDPDSDEVDVRFHHPDPLPLRHWPEAVPQPDPGGTGHPAVLGLSSTWRWLLYNQQGYRDAFQIEFGPPGAEVTLQYLALASRLVTRQVTAVPAD
jgi:hypothetical protein